MIPNIIAALRSPSEIAVEIGRRARERRLALGLRQADLAAAAGVPLATLKRFETGGRGSVETMARLALALRAERELLEPLLELAVTAEQNRADWKLRELLDVVKAEGLREDRRKQL
ncbi:MAG TPA: helix-turn-helix transcriptional regulator, partial [Solirubrobacterales bacterium]